MATATSQITIVDLSDTKQLSCYLSSNFGTTQFLSDQSGVISFSPDWSERLIVTPSVFVNGQSISLTSTDIKISWKKQYLSGPFLELDSDEIVSDGTLVVTANKMDSNNKILTYRCEIIYTDSESGTKISSSSSITYSCVSDGEKGEPSVILEIFPENGTIFYENDGIIKLTMSPILHEGNSVVTESGVYKWFKYTQSTKEWILVSSTKECVINKDDVDSVCSYKCSVLYKEKTYEASITVEDKTDPYLAFVYSTNGTVLKNSSQDKGTCLYATITERNVEVDELFSYNISSVYPDSPQEGDFLYKADFENNTVTLMKYTSSQWVKATETHLYTYIWYKENPRNYIDATPYEYARGKVIAVNNSDIKNTTTFFCDIEK